MRPVPETRTTERRPSSRLQRESTARVGRSASELDGAAGAALGLHEGISDAGPAGCDRWPEDLRLRSTLGQLVKGRCKATNLCAYCARLAAVENTELLSLDAMYGPAPELVAILGTRSTSTSPADFYGARRQVHRALQRRWPCCELAALVEFTTGYGANAGGARRPHWNVLVKGVPVDDLEAAGAIIARVWCGQVDAEPEAQYVGAIREHGGLMRYVAMHFQKESQAPPEGWRGHRFLKSRGYLWAPTPAAREEARQALRLKRELWKAHELGLFGQDAEDVAQRAVYEASEMSWELVRLQPLPTAFGADGLPVAWATEVVAV